MKDPIDVTEAAIRDAFPGIPADLVAEVAVKALGITPVVAQPVVQPNHTFSWRMTYRLAGLEDE